MKLCFRLSERNATSARKNVPISGWNWFENWYHFHNVILRKVNNSIFIRILFMSWVAICYELFDVEFVKNVIWSLRMNYENWTLFLLASQSIVQSYIYPNVVSYSNILNWSRLFLFVLNFSFSCNFRDEIFFIDCFIVRMHSARVIQKLQIIIQMHVRLFLYERILFFWVWNVYSVFSNLPVPWKNGMW